MVFNFFKARKSQPAEISEPPLAGQESTEATMVPVPPRENEALRDEEPLPEAGVDELAAIAELAAIVEVIGAAEVGVGREATAAVEAAVVGEFSPVVEILAAPEVVPAPEVLAAPQVSAEPEVVASFNAVLAAVATAPSEIDVPPKPIAVPEVAGEVLNPPKVVADRKAPPVADVWPTGSTPAAQPAAPQLPPNAAQPPASQRETLRATREDVIAAYKIFLGRQPESMAVVDPRVGATAMALLVDFLASKEFLDQPSRAQLILAVAKKILDSRQAQEVKVQTQVSSPTPPSDSVPAPGDNG